VAPVVGIVGTGRRGEAQGQSSGAQLRRRGGRGDGRDAAMWKRRVDKRAWCGEREADRWDPWQRFFKLKILPDENS
jgi:hypothetical protein